MLRSSTEAAEITIMLASITIGIRMEAILMEVSVFPAGVVEKSD